MALAFALQCYGTPAGKGDVHAAAELCQLLADIEPDPRRDCYFMMVFRRDTPKNLQDKCVGILSEKFNVDGIVAKNFGTKHPYGSNLLWDSAMCEVEAKYRDHNKAAPGRGKFPYNGVLTFEPDCIPLRRDWIKALTREWDEVVISAGHWADEEESDLSDFHAPGWPKLELMGHKDNDHINGNMVLRPDIRSRHQVPFTTDCGWDYYGPNRDKFLKIGHDTNLILQHYRRVSITREELPFLKKNDVIPAIFHGVQGDVGKKARRLIRDTLLEEATV